MEQQYYIIFGMVFVCLCTVIGVGYGIYNQVKKGIQDQSKPIEELNRSILELTYEIKHIREDDEVKNKRLDKHGEEIDRLNTKVTDNSRRITTLEDHLKSTH